MARYKINWCAGTNHTIYRDPKDVYHMVLRIMGCYDSRECTEEQHAAAADAEGWCETHGCAGERYDGTRHGFTIDVI